VFVLKLDLVDHKILQLLSKNGRMSYVDIGKELNLSRVAIRERVHTLMKEGIIEKFTVVVNTEKVGKQIQALFEVECIPSEMIEVAKKLSEHPSVVSCYEMTGPSTLHLQVLVQSQEQLDQFLHDELYQMEGIKRVQSHILLRTFKRQADFELM